MAVFPGPLDRSFYAPRIDVVVAQGASVRIGRDPGWGTAGIFPTMDAIIEMGLGTEIWDRVSGCHCVVRRCAASGDILVYDCLSRNGTWIVTTSCTGWVQEYVVPRGVWVVLPSRGAGIRLGRWRASPIVSIVTQERFLSGGA